MFYPVIGQFEALIRLIASPWSGVRNFPYNPLATVESAVALLAVVRIKPLCQALPPWRHNAISWWRHTQNIAGFRNLESDTLSNVKRTGNIDWILYFWYHGIKIKLRLARRSLTPLGRSGGPYHVTTQFCYFIYDWMHRGLKHNERGKTYWNARYRHAHRNMPKRTLCYNRTAGNAHKK